MEERSLSFSFERRFFFGQIVFYALIMCLHLGGNYLARQFLLEKFSPLFLSAFSLTVISIFFCLLAF